MVRVEFLKDVLGVPVEEAEGPYDPVREANYRKGEICEIPECAYREILRMQSATPWMRAGLTERQRRRILRTVQDPWIRLAEEAPKKGRNQKRTDPVTGHVVREREKRPARFAVARRKTPEKKTCPACGKKFIEPGYTRHVRACTEEKTPEAKPFPCDACGKSYDTEHGLKVHVGKEHPEEKQDGRRKKSETCPACGETFAPAGFGIHRKTCTGPGTTGAQKEKLVGRDNGRPKGVYACPFCDFTAPHPVHVRHHRDREHPDEVAEERRRQMRVVG